MAKTRVSAADVLFGIAAPSERSFRNKIVGLITLQRMGLNIIVLPLALGIAALAGASFNDLRLLPLLIATFLTCGVAVMTNDIIDAERDKTKWPLKPLATGLISKSEAALYTAILAGLALVIAILAFNALSAALLLVVLVLQYVYARYMRDNIGFLTVILAAAFIPVAVWSAISPETVLTPPPWFLVIFWAAFATAVQITQEALDPTIPALFVRPRPTTERALFIASVIVMFFFGVAIYFYAQLSWLFVVALAVLMAWTVIPAKNLGDNRSREKLESSYKIIFISGAIYWSLVAVFVWIK